MLNNELLKLLKKHQDTNLGSEYAREFLMKEIKQAIRKCGYNSLHNHLEEGKKARLRFYGWNWRGLIR